MLLRKFLKFTAVGRLVMIPVRLGKIALPCALRQLGLMVRWTFTSKEYYNHSYHLTDLNKHYLASYISVVSGHDLATIEKYIAELEGDEKLRATLEQRTRASRDRPIATWSRATADAWAGTRWCGPPSRACSSKQPLIAAWAPPSLPPR